MTRRAGAPLGRVLVATERVVAGLLGLLLVAMVLLNVANAAGRYVVGRAIDGSDEVLVFSMVWIVFIGTVLVTGRDRHLGFDLAARLFRGRWGALRTGMLDIGLAVLAGYVALQSFGFVDRLARLGQVSMAADIPMAVPHAAVLVGMALTALLAGLRGIVRLAAFAAPGLMAPAARGEGR
ncbi:MAG: TRAP transporter small permease [Azospirillaceae bacterium]